jgi:chromosome segregation ATPase
MDQLTSTRTDNDDLKLQLQSSQSQFYECREAYDTLISRLRDEAPTLKERDRSRFKSLLQDLKDYEVYKEVMETAMMKLQDEIKALKSDNDYLKSKEANAQKKLQRNRSVVSKYNNDTSAILKRNKELEELLVNYENRVLKAEHQKESAVKTLNSTKIGLSKRVNELKKKEDLDIVTQRAYEKKIEKLEIASKVLYDDKVKASNDLKSLKVASKKSLMLIMELQEENQALKQAIAELAPKAGLISPAASVVNGGGGGTVVSDGETSVATTNA